jgi:hypothetical protein
MNFIDFYQPSLRFLANVNLMKNEDQNPLESSHSNYWELNQEHNYQGKDSSAHLIIIYLSYLVGSSDKS